MFNCSGAAREGNGIPYPQESAAVSVMAEGLVDGHRVSQPLKTVKLSVAGMSAVFWQQPEKGAWLLNIRITGAGPYFIGGNSQSVIGTALKVGPEGIERRTRLLHIPPTADEIDRTLLRISQAGAQSTGGA